MCCVSMAMPWETDPGGLKAYQNLFRKYKRLQGRFYLGVVRSRNPCAKKTERHIITTADVMGISYQWKLLY